MNQLLILVAIGCLVFACYSPKVDKHETTAYRSASPENREKIEESKIEVGMSIDECKASRPDYQFTKKFASSNGTYELWEAKKAEEKDIYIHILNGTVEKVSVAPKAATKNDAKNKKKDRTI